MISTDNNKLARALDAFEGAAYEGRPDAARAELERVIREAISAAVLDERETCARVATEASKIWRGGSDPTAACRQIAADIRARGEG